MQLRFLPISGCRELESWDERTDSLASWVQNLLDLRRVELLSFEVAGNVLNKIIFVTGKVLLIGMILFVAAFRKATEALSVWPLQEVLGKDLRRIRKFGRILRPLALECWTFENIQIH